MRLVLLGEERAADILGIKFSLLSESLPFKPRIQMAYESMSDPLPGRDDRLDPVRFEPSVPSDRTATYTRYSLVTKPYTDALTTVSATGTYSVLTHKAEEVKIDDFKSIGINGTLAYRFLPAVNFKLLWGWDQRTFVGSASRKDGISNFSFFSEYYFNPDFYADFRYDNTTMSSSDEVYSYSATCFL